MSERITGGREQRPNMNSPTDAIVMASAARRGDVAYTSDFHDLERLRAYFPNLRVLGI